MHTVSPPALPYRIALRPGDSLVTEQGDFRLLATLGKGGMGRVYAAQRQEEHRKYALKVLHPEILQIPEMLRLYKSEANVLGLFADHVHIVNVHGVFVSSSPVRVPFLLMDLLTGETLSEAQVRCGRPLSLEEICTLALDLLWALDALEKKGIVHQDIKPDNLFLRRLHGGRVVTTLIDFGIFQSSALNQSEHPYFVGTPRYAAPEQFLRQPVTPQTDLYAASVLLYELLSGQHPFPFCNTLQDYAHAYENHIPTPPHVLVPSLPEALSCGLMSALRQKQHAPQKIHARDLIVLFRSYVHSLHEQQIAQKAQEDLFSPLPSSFPIEGWLQPAQRDNGVHPGIRESVPVAPLFFPKRLPRTPGAQKVTLPQAIGLPFSQPLFSRYAVALGGSLCVLLLLFAQGIDPTQPSVSKEESWHLAHSPFVKLFPWHSVTFSSRHKEKSSLLALWTGSIQFRQLQPDRQILSEPSTDLAQSLSSSLLFIIPAPRSESMVRTGLLSPERTPVARAVPFFPRISFDSLPMPCEEDDCMELENLMDTGEESLLFSR